MRAHTPIKVWSDPHKGAGNLLIPNGENLYRRWPVASPPGTMWVEGCTSSGYLSGEDGLRLWWYTPYIDWPPYPGAQYNPDLVSVTIVEVDMDMLGLVDADEESVGGYIALGGEKQLTLWRVQPPGEPPAGVPLDSGHPMTLDVEYADRGSGLIEIWDYSEWPPEKLSLPKTYDSTAFLLDDLHIKGTSASSMLRGITIIWEYTIGGRTVQDRIKCTVVEVDLDIVGVGDEDEESVGQVVVLNFDDNEAPRKEVILRKVMPNDWSGNVILSRSDNNVELFASETGGEELDFDGTDNKFANSILPMSLWVEGNIASSFMRDVALTLEAEGISDCDDTVSFTVLWVNLSTDHTGSVNEDNSAKAEYEKLPLPAPDSSLGYHLYCFSPPDAAAWLGRGTEIMGHVTVLDFDPTLFSSDAEALHLKREIVNGNRFWQEWGETEVYSDEATPGDDTSQAVRRDDIPLSGDPPSPAVIYDVDAPGPSVKWDAGILERVRVRINFRQWAVWEGIRCSEKLSWFTRQSYQKGSLESSDVGATDSWTDNTITDNNKSWTTNRWAPGVVQYDVMTIREVGRIQSNNGTTITAESNWTLTPMVDTYFQVIDTATWGLNNEVAGDNISGNGATNITWDLE